MNRAEMRRELYIKMLTAAAQYATQDGWEKACRSVWQAASEAAEVFETMEASKQGQTGGGAV